MPKGCGSMQGRHGKIQNRDQKWVRLPMGHLIGPNRAAWYDFCHIKNLKFLAFPIIRCGAICKGAMTNRDQNGSGYNSIVVVIDRTLKIGFLGNC